jgi:hypothetical protein
MDQDTLRFLLREAVRETVTEVLQTVLELDRTAFLQAHGGRRNGYYPRRLETTFGQVDLKVPRDREGQYYPAFLKPYARRLVDVGEVAVALYAAGVSQRKAAEVTGPFGDPILALIPPPGPHFRGRPWAPPGPLSLPEPPSLEGRGKGLWSSWPTWTRPRPTSSTTPGGSGASGWPFWSTRAWPFWPPSWPSPPWPGPWAFTSSSRPLSSSTGSFPPPTWRGATTTEAG